MKMLEKHTLHSGGAKGADERFEIVGAKFGMSKFRHYYITGYKTPRGNWGVALEPNLHSIIDNDLFLVNKILKRHYPMANEYANNLLRRNWFQVSRAHSVYAVSSIVNGIVQGGTGWAAHLAILYTKPLFVFDQEQNAWYKYCYSTQKFITPEKHVVILDYDFAGIGSRKLNDNGARAIDVLYTLTNIHLQNKKI